MSKETAKKITRRRLAIRRGAFLESNSCRTQESEVPPNDRPRGTKRKASADDYPAMKRVKACESQNTSEESLIRKVLKRKIKDDGEEPSNKRKRRRVDLLRDDDQTASSSTDTGGGSSGNLFSSCNTSVEDERRTATKRKVSDSSEEPCRKRKRKRSPEPKEIRQDTRPETRLDTRLDTRLETRPETAAVDARGAFRDKYKQQHQLGEGGCGSVFAGYRRADNLPVAIKHVPKDKQFVKHVDEEGRQLSVEVAIMLQLDAAMSGPVGTSAAVSLLDWYDLDQELILVIERPVPAVDLYTYVRNKGGSLQEEEAKVILRQLVDAVKELEDQHIFHRDIKAENILIETGSDVPRVRLIDFGMGCFVKKKSFFRVFYGTSAHVPPEWVTRCTYRAGPTTVWQMGVVLYEMLHKRQGFETRKFLRRMLKFNKGLSTDCQDFLLTCLIKSPEERPTLEELRLHPWLR